MWLLEENTNLNSCENLSDWEADLSTVVHNSCAWENLNSQDIYFKENQKNN